MQTICFDTNLTSAEWAAWVQAVGTIIAVLAAAGIAIWQSRQQHNSALLLHKIELRHTRVARAKTLLALARNCTKAMSHFASEMHDRESIYKIATGEIHFDFGELHHLENTTSGIPLYSLPDTLVTHAMVLGATVRQFRQTVDIAIREHRNMDAEEFLNLFRTLGEMNESLALTCGDIEKAVVQVQQDA